MKMTNLFWLTNFLGFNNLEYYFNFIITWISNSHICLHNYHYTLKSGSRMLYFNNKDLSIPQFRPGCNKIIQNILETAKNENNILWKIYIFEKKLMLHDKITLILHNS